VAEKLQNTDEVMFSLSKMQDPLNYVTSDSKSIKIKQPKPNRNYHEKP